MDNITIKFILCIFVTAIISYLLGSLNSSIIVCKTLKGQDIRQVGSKNAGLTNTIRCFGKGAGALTLIGDLLKGIIAVVLSRIVFELMDIGLAVDSADNLRILHGGSTVFVGYIAGFFAILGHIFPVYYGFKGGKGVLVSSSILIVVDIRTFAIIIPLFLIISFSTRYISVGSISAATIYPFLTFVVQYYWRDMELQLVLTNVFLVAFTAVLLIYMHRSNVKRLINKTENKIKIGKPKQV
jgi:glycerol-3-phosphate acyltransferase PlsY